ncbi:MAG TPA: tetratricopeptide repeat protein [Thermoanaerobaculia bacterium]|nr:tetratricopeptide repeat protein [Thermoanaerobaculia bacterium]
MHNSRRWCVVLGCCLAWGVLPTSAAPPPPSDPYAEAVRQLDAGLPEAALAALEKAGGKRGDGRFYLLRATARLMLGETEAGRKDLTRALELDPSQRQGWLNLAALHLAESRHAEAKRAFEQAEKLDPGAADNHANIGAVLLLQGDLGGAAERFRRYLAAQPSAEAYYLVASNYALAGQAQLAADHLARAIRLDERTRFSARSDPNFAALVATPTFATLMSADPRPPSPDDYVAQRTYAEPYDGAGGKLLTAVLTALQLSGERFDPRVEVSERWALVWGDLRVVVRSTPEGEGLVEVSCPPERMSLNDWNRRSEALLRTVAAKLLTGR